MEKIEFLELGGPNLLVQFGYLVEEALKKSVREALRKHKLAGNPVAVAKEGRVVILEPSEILVD